MRLDHIAYRCKNRNSSIDFFKDAFGYIEQEEFEIYLEDGSRALCMALEPPEKRSGAPFITKPGFLAAIIFSSELNTEQDNSRSLKTGLKSCLFSCIKKTYNVCKFLFNESWKIVAWNRIEYHLAPEIFVSEGPKGGLIWNWVENNCPGRNGGIHHLAYSVDNVKDTMDEWKKKGYLFTTEEPLVCPDLIQVFTSPHPETGIIYEFIERTGSKGFCKENVSKLMNSTSDLS